MRSIAAVRVLLAEDDDQLRVLLAEFFLAEGFEVLVASDGVQLLALLESNRGDEAPDIVVTDVDMPGLSGLDVLSLLRSEGSRQAFVVITGRADPELRERAGALDVLAILKKPIDLEVLLEHVRGAVARRETSHADRAVRDGSS